MIDAMIESYLKREEADGEGGGQQSMRRSTAF